MARTVQITGSPLEREVARLQNAGADIEIQRISPDDYALIRVRDALYVAHVDECNGVGRWECSVQHAEHYAALYAERFPIAY